MCAKLSVDYRKITPAFLLTESIHLFEMFFLWNICRSGRCTASYFIWVHKYCYCNCTAAGVNNWQRQLNTERNPFNHVEILSMIFFTEFKEFFLFEWTWSRRHWSKQCFMFLIKPCLRLTLTIQTNASKVKERKSPGTEDKFNDINSWRKEYCGER